MSDRRQFLLEQLRNPDESLKSGEYIKVGFESLVISANLQSVEPAALELVKLAFYAGAQHTIKGVTHSGAISGEEGQRMFMNIGREIDTWTDVFLKELQAFKEKERKS